MRLTLMTSKQIVFRCTTLRTSHILRCSITYLSGGTIQLRNHASSTRYTGAAPETLHIDRSRPCYLGGRIIHLVGVAHARVIVESTASILNWRQEWRLYQVGLPVAQDRGREAIATGHSVGRTRERK